MRPALVEFIEQLQSTPPCGRDADVYCAWAQFQAQRDGSQGAADELCMFHYHVELDPSPLAERLDD